MATSISKIYLKKKEIFFNISSYSFSIIVEFFSIIIDFFSIIIDFFQSPISIIIENFQYPFQSGLKPILKQNIEKNAFQSGLIFFSILLRFSIRLKKFNPWTLRVNPFSTSTLSNSSRSSRASSSLITGHP